MHSPTGDECQTDIDECAGNPCQNNGVCTDGVNSFECACANGWSGKSILNYSFSDIKCLSLRCLGIYWII